MPVKITCIEDGCLSERNGGDSCQAGQCLACRVPHAAGVGETRNLAAATAAIEADIAKLPAGQAAALRELVLDQMTGRSRSSIEIGDHLGVTEAVVERSRFAYRWLTAELSRLLSTGS